jgi:hypothetical protein
MSRLARRVVRRARRAVPSALEVAGVALVALAADGADRDLAILVVGVWLVIVANAGHGEGG